MKKCELERIHVALDNLRHAKYAKREMYTMLSYDDLQLCTPFLRAEMTKTVKIGELQIETDQNAYVIHEEWNRDMTWFLLRVNTNVLGVIDASIDYIDAFYKRIKAADIYSLPGLITVGKPGRSALDVLTEARNGKKGELNNWSVEEIPPMNTDWSGLEAAIYRKILG